MSLAVDDEVLTDAAQEIMWPGLWTRRLRGHVAFSRPVTVHWYPDRV